MSFVLQKTFKRNGFWSLKLSQFGLLYFFLFGVAIVVATVVVVVDADASIGGGGGGVAV